MSKKNIISVVVLIIVAGLSFFGGQAYANKNKQGDTRANFQGQFRMGTGMNRMNARGMGGNLVSGTVIAKDDQSITIKDRDGSSKIIFFTQNTPVAKMVAGGLGDVVVGKDITIIGSANAEGSVSAQSIQIRQAQPQDMKQ